MSTYRLAGHAARFATGNGVCVKPTCKCGWIGYAQPQNGARVQYRNHIAVEQERARKLMQDTSYGYARGAA
jgi:hypothetical protein